VAGYYSIFVLELIWLQIDQKKATGAIIGLIYKMYTILTFLIRMLKIKFFVLGQMCIKTEKKDDYYIHIYIEVCV